MEGCGDLNRTVYLWIDSPSTYPTTNRRRLALLREIPTTRDAVCVHALRQLPSHDLHRYLRFNLSVTRHQLDFPDLGAAKRGDHEVLYRPRNRERHPVVAVHTPGSALAARRLHAATVALSIALPILSVHRVTNADMTQGRRWATFVATINLKLGAISTGVREFHGCEFVVLIVAVASDSCLQVAVKNSLHEQHTTGFAWKVVGT